MSREKSILRKGLELYVIVLVLVALQVVVSALLFVFPALVLMVGIRLLETAGSLFWPGGF
jgi:hypothetical protein